MVSVTLASRYITSASRYHPRYQSRSSMYIRGWIPRNFAELTEAVPIAAVCRTQKLSNFLGAAFFLLRMHADYFNKGLDGGGGGLIFTIHSKFSPLFISFKFWVIHLKNPIIH